MSSGFSADWLALREPADLAARDAGLMRDLGEALGERAQPIEIVDLGCGTGSNLRGLAPHLPPRQRWRLVDHDPALLLRARDSLSVWADSANDTGDTLVLARGASQLTVSFHQHDLATDLASALGPAPDLVTAAALFDLVSAPTIDRLAHEVSTRRARFHAALTYDGREEWQPPHPADAAMRVAFLRHLSGDKGFGAAAGQLAPGLMAEAFGRHLYRVRTAPSPWRLGPAEAALRSALAGGEADAVAETGLVPVSEIESWREARMREGSATIGHVDLLALPP